MYHCHVCFYLLGKQPGFYDFIKKSEPLAHFEHEFLESEEPEREQIDRADVIFANLQGMDAEKVLVHLTAYREKEREMILIADKEQTAGLVCKDLPDDIADIWSLPMSEEELHFRFLRWQRLYKKDKDFWQTRNFLDATINHVPHLIWYKDKEGVHEKVNQSFCKAVGKTMEQIEGRGHYYIWDITPEEYSKGEYVCMESEYEVMEKKETCIFDESVKIGDEMRELMTYKTPLFDLDGSVMGTVGVGMDVTQERLYEQMILNNANTDFQTGLYNRRYVYQFMEQKGEAPLTVFFLDLDNFKEVNDRYGHQEGDRLLLVTTNALKKCMPDDVIARMGGDEFLVIRPGEIAETEMEDKRKWLQEQLDMVYIKDKHFGNVSASIGAAYSEKGNRDIDLLIGEADSFMYRVKNEKKSRR